MLPKKRKRLNYLATKRPALYVSILIACAFFGLGAYLLQRGSAASNATNREVEQSSLTGDAAVFSDTSASGGSYIRFGSNNANNLLPASLSPAGTDTHWNNVFARVQKPRGWIGGDGGASVRLPDGRILFLFADTLIGIVNNDKTVAPFWKLISNSLVTVSPNGSNFTAYYKGAPGQESSYIPPPAGQADSPLWPYSATVDGNKVNVLLNQWQIDPVGVFGYSFTGHTWLVQLNASTLEIESTSQIITGDQIQWGSATYQDQDYTYVYGILPGVIPAVQSYAYRLPRGNMTAPPQYHTGSGWSTNRSQAAPITDIGIGSVAKLRDGTFRAVFLVDPFPRQIKQASAPSPVGPWTVLQTPVYTMPEADTYGVFAYMPRIHDSFDPSDGFLISYSLNAFIFGDVIQSAPKYQIHFARGPAAQ